MPSKHKDRFREAAVRGHALIDKKGRWAGSNEYEGMGDVEVAVLPVTRSESGEIVSVGGITNPMLVDFRKELEEQDDIPATTYSTPYGWALYYAIAALFEETEP